jgi:hypothetical protein
MKIFGRHFRKSEAKRRAIFDTLALEMEAKWKQNGSAQNRI